MNQVLKTVLRTYVNEQRNNWHECLVPFQHAYNNTIHSSTGHTPQFLLCGFHPLDPEKLLAGRNEDAIPRRTIENKDAEFFAEGMEALRSAAKDALRVAQAFQERAYNNGRLDFEFEEGDQVLLNPHSMNLLKATTGKGKKLLSKYDGPFEISAKLSPVTYRLRLPASYRIHPVINIAHLQPYRVSPPEFGERSRKHLNREDFEELPEYEVERIMDEKWEDLPARKGRRSRRIKRYLTRFVGYGPEWDEWLTSQDLRNAPAVMREWNDRAKPRGEESGSSVAKEEVNQNRIDAAPSPDEGLQEIQLKRRATTVDEPSQGENNAGRQLRSRRLPAQPGKF
ncbi:hypothetical protein FRC01_008900 [Tulasnella sp. 417]|nr:hypothetical protein FRC01_008900 [Tulasnella sp. 417]